MKGVCAIISGGEYSPLSGIENADFVIVCDRGYDYALRSGVGFDLFVGDFDSCTEIPAESTKILSLPTEKDDTDTMAAMRYAVSEGYREIVLYCALGGRFDHAYANLQTAGYAAEAGCRVRIISNDCEIHVLHNSSLGIPKIDGFSLSVFSLSDSCEDVCEKGVKYPLDSAVLKNTFPLGVSNEWAENTAEISVKRGTLAVIISKK